MLPVNAIDDRIDVVTANVEARGKFLSWNPIGKQAAA